MPWPIPDAKDIQEELMKAAVASYERMDELASEDEELKRELVRSAISLAEVQRQMDYDAAGIETLSRARKKIEDHSGEEVDLLRAETYVLESRLYGEDAIDKASGAIDQAIRLTENWTGSC